MALPPCGLYATRATIGSIPPGRLVYFHNHGNPGPGIYLPASWKGNRARFEARGHEVHYLDKTSGVQAIERTPTGWFAGADPRREGTARGDAVTPRR